MRGARRALGWTAAATLLGAAAACAGAIPRTTPALAAEAQRRWPEMDAERFERARSTYIARCAGCHPLPTPRAMSAEDWPGTMADMGRRSKLDAATSEDLLRWVLVARDAPR